MSGGLWGLFFGSFLASTIVPGGVEGLLYFMSQQSEFTFVKLLVVASVGNTLGGIFTWWVGLILYRGLSGRRFLQPLEKWFRLDDKSLVRVRQWGTPALLLSWMPIIGDPLCLAAGYLRLRFWPCALMIAIGKFSRYLVLLYLFYD